MGDVELLFSMVFKVATLFIGDKDHGSAVTVLQKAAEYTLLFPRLRPSLDPEELGLSHRLEAEYLILRTALALKESRIDVAEHMYAKVEQLRASLDPTSAENLAEVLFATVDVCVLQGKPLKASTAVAAHTIIWKKIETLPESDHAETRK
ncbi:hypothetical protein HYQ46_005330 [Verticillium longisporum]|nr:hypothetical protein HYQ46_005330 [Verticillium longisporum]